jgi:hypothetical protein
LNDTKQGCQTAYFQTKNPNLGQFGREGVGIGDLVYFTTILWLFGIFFQFWYVVP